MSTFDKFIRTLALGSSNAPISSNLITPLWPNLHKKLKQNKLLPFTYACLEKPLPETIQKEYQCDQAKIHLKHSILKNNLSSIEKALTEKAIPHIWLKGPVDSARFYPTPACRASDDLDLFIPAHGIDETIECLMNMNFTPLTPLWPLTPKQRKHYLKWHKDITLLAHQTKMPIECHYKLMDTPGFYTLDFDTAYARHDTVQIDGQGFPCLHPIDTLLYTTAHCAKHLQQHALWWVDMIRQYQQLSPQQKIACLRQAEAMGTQHAIPKILKQVLQIIEDQIPLSHVQAQATNEMTRLKHIWQLTPNWRYRSSLYYKIVGPLNLTWESFKLPDCLFILYHFLHLRRFPIAGIKRLKAKCRL